MMHDADHFSGFNLSLTNCFVLSLIMMFFDSHALLSNIGQDW